MAVDSSDIKSLLQKVFDSKDSLIIYCFDNFDMVYKKFAAGMSYAEKMDLLIDYCSKHKQCDKLLEEYYKRFSGSKVLQLFNELDSESLAEHVQELYDRAYKLRLTNVEKACEHCQEGLKSLEKSSSTSFKDPNTFAYSRGKFHLLMACIYLDNETETDLQSAEEHYSYSLDEFRSRRWSHLECVAGLGLAITQRKLGDFDEAMKICEEALDRAEHGTTESKVNPSALNEATQVIEKECSLISESLSPEIEAPKTFKFQEKAPDKVLVEIELQGDQKAIERVEKNDLAKVIARFLGVKIHKLSQKKLEKNILSFKISKELAFHLKSLHESHNYLDFEIKRYGQSQVGDLHIEDIGIKYIWKVPILNDIAAGLGRPIAEDDIKGYRELKENEQQEDDYFIVEVEGDSMIGDFSPGDKVLIRQQESVETGKDIAAIVITTPDRETPLSVLKRYNCFEREGKYHWFLESSNPSAMHLVVTPENTNVAEIRKMYDKYVRANKVILYENAELEIVGKYIKVVDPS